jgi:hypothetical protein
LQPHFRPPFVHPSPPSSPRKATRSPDVLPSLARRIFCAIALLHWPFVAESRVTLPASRAMNRIDTQREELKHSCGLVTIGPFYPRSIEQRIDSSSHFMEQWHPLCSQLTIISNSLLRRSGSLIVCPPVPFFVWYYNSLL